MALNAACILTLFFIVLCASIEAADYPGVIELVGYSNRRARTQFMDSANPTLTPPASKTRADIETVRRNMKKYDRLLELDVKNLPEPQKDMLARIVERVARLKETLDIEEQQQQQQQVSTVPASSMETETEPTLLLDETTLLQLQHTMNEQATLQAEQTATTDVVGNTELAETTTTATTQSETNEDNVADESTTETFTDATAADEQFVAARSNNNIAAITAADADTTATTTTTTAGNQRTLTTMGKLKIRATKRPFNHKVRQGQRPAVTIAAATTTGSKQKLGNNNNKHKLTTNTNPGTITPALPLEQLYTRTPQANLAVPAAAAAAAAAAVAPVANNSNAPDAIVYDAHVNASALIDSLNTHAREEYYQQKINNSNSNKQDNKVSPLHWEK
ncbi:hypothetical protein ACLKA7_017492 [Drosophila subpalustris]